MFNEVINNKILSKKETAKILIKDFNSFSCPICKSKLELNNDSLVCKYNHNFNINKKGFSSLLKRQKKFSTKIYTRELFENRRKVINENFYNGIYDYVCEFINNNLNDNNIILELGGGESTHSLKIKNKLNNNKIYISSDIIKEAVEMSSDYLTSSILPIVCDVYNLPIEDKSVDCIIDFLSPYSYKEVYRVLNKNGYFIKICPAKHYLKEIRTIANFDEYNKDEDVMENLQKHFEIMKKFSYKKTFKINEDLSSPFIKMTPLTQYKNISKSFSQITIDLNVFVMKVIDK